MSKPMLADSLTKRDALRRIGPIRYGKLNRAMHAVLDALVMLEHTIGVVGKIDKESSAPGQLRAWGCRLSEKEKNVIRELADVKGFNSQLVSKLLDRTTADRLISRGIVMRYDDLPNHKPVYFRKDINLGH